MITIEELETTNKVLRANNLLALQSIQEKLKSMGLQVIGGTCKDCKHWKKDERCALLSDTDVITIVAKYAQREPEIYTPPDFACNQWEPKE